MKEEAKLVQNDAEILSSQEQIHDLLFSREIGWQEIIYDLINSEQLDPWNINITILSDKYLEKIEKLEETDFLISSKVLLAAALLLRIKSEVLLNKYIKSIDEILFGKKETKKQILERIELDEEIPELVPRSPIPRFKKVTLKELIDSLNKAIITENRRIKKELIRSDVVREITLSLPKKRYIISDKIKDIYDKIFGHLNSEDKKRLLFHHIVKDNKEEKIISFHSILHLENQNKIWIEQDEHFGEIRIWLRETFIQNNPELFTYESED